ncbi:MAG: YciI family protein [Planctomycetota bacterium]|jgi:hypothetical protein
MNHYLLSVHSAPGASCHNQAPEEMQASMKRIEALESEMKAADVLYLSGRLSGPESATVVRASEGELLTTDGPFVEAKEYIAGFYVLRAADLDAALSWASKVTECLGKPIEVRPFMGLMSF